MTGVTRQPTYIDEKVEHDQGYHGRSLHADDTFAAVYSRNSKDEIGDDHDTVSP